MNPRRRLVAGLVLGVLAPAGLWAAGAAVPWIAMHLSVLVALIFILVPRWLAPADDTEPSSPALSAARSAGLSLLLLAWLLPFFLLGHHLWMTTHQGWTASPSTGAWVQLPDEVRGTAPLRDDALSLSRHEGRLHLRWAPTEGGTLHLRSDAMIVPLRPHSDMLFSTNRGEAGEWSWSVAPGEALTLAFATRDGSHLTLRAQDHAGDLPAERYLLGAGASPPRSSWQEDVGWRLPLGHSWILFLVLMHVVVIAIPEEIFFRGFLQRQFEDNGHTQALLSLGGWSITRANLWTSVAFAVGHGLIGLDPLRLAVFFPSLVFGALRDRSGGLTAPVVFHVGCNLMVAFTVPHYLPLGS